MASVREPWASAQLLLNDAMVQCSCTQIFLPSTRLGNEAGIFVCRKINRGELQRIYSNLSNSVKNGVKAFAGFRIPAP